MIRVDFIIKLKKGDYDKWANITLELNDICEDYKGEVIYRKFDKKTETKRVGANYDSLESLCNCICAITIYMAERGFKEEYKVVDTKHTLLNKKNKKRALELLNELA